MSSAHPTPGTPGRSDRTLGKANCHPIMSIEADGKDIGALKDIMSIKQQRFSREQEQRNRHKPYIHPLVEREKGERDMTDN
ncbi:hypothetical protein FRC17_009557 [Serendipita sp. 399]|nr:hypothetical protein FRC17_009557 [Serendipita sp. 399]